MSYLYHLVPEDMQGDILYPLNQLKERYPYLYTKESQKYVGREHITQQRIPILNCLWNDVLHFSAVHPKEVKQALIDAGRNPDFTMTCFQIEAELIHVEKAVVYLYSQIDSEKKSDDFIPYAPVLVANLSTLPQATKDYYKDMIAKGERPLRYHFVPHVLYKDAFNISGVPVITV